MVDRVFQGEEEENLVLDHRPANVASKVVKLYGRFHPGDAVEPERSGIQDRVLEVVVAHAVETVCSALADLVIENTATAGLRGEKRTTHLHFRNGVEDRSVNDVVAHGRAGR